MRRYFSLLNWLTGRMHVLPVLAFFLLAFEAHGAAPTMAPATPPTFPRPLDAYPESDATLMETLKERFQSEPFNLVATIIFLLAIIHTFLAPMFQKMAHHAEQHHREHERHVPTPFACDHQNRRGSKVG